MMQIIKSSKEELDAMEIYSMTKSPEIQVVNKIPDGEVLDVVSYLMYSDVNSKGEEVTLLSMKDKEGYVFTTQSETFRESFMDIVGIAESVSNGNPITCITVKKISGTAKSGRDYVNCVLLGIDTP